MDRGYLNKTISDFRHKSPKNPTKSNFNLQRRISVLSKSSGSLKRKHEGNDEREPKRQNLSSQASNNRRWSHPGYTEKSKSNDINYPNYKNYQLLGDSQLMRFSEQMLKFKKAIEWTAKGRTRRIGHCVSGQKIGDLKLRLEDNDYIVGNNVIMMIGTNDIIYNTNIQNMCSEYSEIVKNLRSKCLRLVLLTIPPVPKLMKSTEHWNKLKIFNSFIQRQVDDEKVFGVDLCSTLISYNNSVNVNYFEEVYGNGPKVDLIHLNKKGFKMLMAVLNIEYFEEYY